MVIKHYHRMGTGLIGLAHPSNPVLRGMLERLDIDPDSELRVSAGGITFRMYCMNPEEVPLIIGLLKACGYTEVLF